MISTLSSNPSLLRETTLPPACREHSMGPLFPKASLHLWILLILCDGCLVSQMKLKVKGRLHGTKGGFFMVEAKKQLGRLKHVSFANDTEKLLRTRAMDLVCGGFMALLFPCIPTGANPSECSIIASFEVLCSSLMDLVKSVSLYTFLILYIYVCPSACYKLMVNVILT